LRKFVHSLSVDRASRRPSKVVVTTCMRNLLVILNAMLKNKTKWSPEKCLANA
jgi:hypothetical protein